MISSKLQNSNKKKKTDKKNKNVKGQKTGYIKKKQIPIFRNENIIKENYNILFQRTYNDNFRGDNNKSIK